MHVIMAKNKITRAESRKPMPKTSVASMPVGILGSGVRTVEPWREHLETYGRRHRRQVKNMVNRLLYCLFVLWDRGTGLMPFSSAPESRNLWYHFGCFSGLNS